jgi:hypothetical protein
MDVVQEKEGKWRGKNRNKNENIDRKVNNTKKKQVQQFKKVQSSR